MYISGGEEAVSEMERQRLAGYGDIHEKGDKCCMECKRYVYDEPLYNNGMDGVWLCISCSSERLRLGLYSAVAVLDKSVEWIFEIILERCDFEELVREEFRNEG